MSERIVSMHAAHRSGKEVVDGFLSRPTIVGERPAVVLVHGYCGLDDGSPDLFHGKTYHMLEDCALKKTSLDIPRAVANIVDSVPYFRKLPWVGKKKVAVLGFCMGGGLALYALAQSKAFDAGVISYQSMFPDPEDLKSNSAPMLCHYGTEDHGTTQTEIDMFRESLDRYKRKYQIEMYAGAGHAFLNNPSGKNAANRVAAKKSVVSTTKWLKKPWRR